MAIYHYHRGIGKRASGKNAVFAVAYIRGEKRTCDKIQETKDFSLKEDVAYTNCILPDDAPKWAIELRESISYDSEGSKHEDITGEQFSIYAWNQIEYIENRVDSQLYFHDDIAIPNDLPLDKSVELIEEFIKSNIAINGIFCDVAIHWDKGNHHAHIVFPIRQLTETGFGKKLRFKQSDLRKEVLQVRAAWAEFANRKMAQCGINQKIDHRSYQDRGLDLIPTVKLGKANHAHQEVIHQRKLDENKKINEVNAEKIINNPRILSQKISQENIVFSQDVVSSHTNEIVRNTLASQTNPSKEDQELLISANGIIKKLQNDHGIINEKNIKSLIMEDGISIDLATDLYNKVIESGDILSLGLGEDGREHFVSREAFEMEGRVLSNSNALSENSHFVCDYDDALVVASEFGLNQSQSKALGHLVSTGDLALVSGYAGTGKTYLLKAAKKIWDKQNFNLVGLSTSGKAASGLEDETGISSYTIAGFLKGVESGAITVDSNTIIVMDEMGMTSLDDMDEVLKIARIGEAKFTGIGDIEQTQPVGRGAAFRGMVETVGAVNLDEIIRQKVEWQKEATYYFETNQTDKGLALYEEHQRIHMSANTDDSINLLIHDWYERYSKDGLALDESVIAAFTNQAVDGLNVHARQKLLDEGVIKNEALVGGMHVGVGERILFTENDYKAGVRNGQFASVLAIHDDVVCVKLDNGKEINIEKRNFANVKYGYAATIHKLQGYTGNYTYLMIDGQGWDRHKLLVGASRHRNDLNIYAANDIHASMSLLQESVSRHGLNDTLYDYPVAFGARRGYDVDNLSSRGAGLISRSRQKVFGAISFLFNVQNNVEAQSAKPLWEIERDEMLARRNNAVLVAEFADLRAEMASIFSTVKDGETLSDEQSRSLYQLNIQGGDMATTILEDFDKYRVACERNRVSTDKLATAKSFYDNAQAVGSLVTVWKSSHDIDEKRAYQLSSDIKSFYPHVCAALDDKKERSHFLRDVNHLAQVEYRETAILKFGIEKRAQINLIMRFNQLEYESQVLLDGIDSLSDADREALSKINLERNKIAHTLVNTNHINNIINHFNLKEDRLNTLSLKHEDKLLVERFTSYAPTEKDKPASLQKQYLAHVIKSDVKRYGHHVYSLLEDGWKSVNIENWHYNKRVEKAHSSQQVKSSIATVAIYKQQARLAYIAWQKAFKSKNKFDDNHKLQIKKAQGMTYQRMKQASKLMANLSNHIAVLSDNKVDTKRLADDKRIVDYIERYRATTKEPLKLHMAAFIFNNIKKYRAGLAVYGLEREIFEKNAHYQYLKALQKAPTPEHKALIRLADKYLQQSIESSSLWRELKTFGNEAQASTFESKRAANAFEKRDSLAYELASFIQNHEHLNLSLEPFKIDFNKVLKQAHTHETRCKIEQYQGASLAEKAGLAKTLINDKSAYYLLKQNSIEIKSLYQDIQESKKQQFITNTTDKGIQSNLWDYELINQALSLNPEDTYQAILGDPKERTPKTLRYDGGLIVTIKGSKSGAWYSHTEELGGGPIQAIQHYLGYDFKEALAFGAEICGLSESEAKQQSFSPSPIISKETNHKDERQMSIESAQSIWNGAVAAKSSLTETYFTKHRGVVDISNMSIRHWPEGSKWLNINEQGILEEKINKVPAAVIAARDPLGKVVGVQRIYLDKHTGDKNSFMKNAKLSKGVIKGMPGIIQEGIKGGVVYVAEGPETAASIALTNKDATVLTSFSVSNLSQIGTALEKYQPSEVIIAADNDGVHSKTKSTIEKAKHSLQEQGFNCKVIYPDMVQGLEKTDWNDVLKQVGVDGLVDEITNKSQLEQTHFERSKSSEYTQLEKVIKEEYGLAGIDLSDVRFDEKQLKAIVPHYNENQAICGESVISLSGLDKANPEVQGSGYYVAHKPEHSKTLYVTDNLIDAKAIGSVNPDALVVLDSKNDLSKLTDWLDMKNLTFEKAIVVSNNHLEQTKRSLSEKAQALIKRGIDVYLAKGKTFDDSITHIKVHESFARAQKIRGIESFVHAIKIDTARIEKSTLKSRFSKLLRQKDFDKKQALNIKTPAPLKATPYYLVLSNKERKAIFDYVDAHNKLKEQDMINHAQKRFAASQNLLKEMADTLKAVQKHPQYGCFKDKLVSTQDISLLVKGNKPLSLIDIKAIANHSQQVELDKGTYQQVQNVSALMQDKKRVSFAEISPLLNGEQKVLIADIAKAHRYQGIDTSDKKYQNLSYLCKEIHEKERMINKQKQSDISQDKDRGR